MSKCKKRVWIGKRPDVPAGWTIYNAPRPLFGQMTWQGEFICGVFYGAADLNAPDRIYYDEQNRMLDAKVLVYVSEEDALAKTLEYLRKEGCDESLIAEASKSELLGSFFAAVDSGDIVFE